MTGTTLPIDGGLSALRMIGPSPDKEARREGFPKDQRAIEGVRVGVIERPRSVGDRQAEADGRFDQGRVEAGDDAVAFPGGEQDTAVGKLATRVRAQLGETRVGPISQRQLGDTQASEGSGRVLEATGTCGCDERLGKADGAGRQRLGVPDEQS